jgi:hypothetical protein
MPILFATHQIGVRTRMGLSARVLSDGTLMILEVPDPDGVAPDFWDDDFPQYRFTDSSLWKQWVEAAKGRRPSPRGERLRRPGPEDPAAAAGRRDRPDR